MYWSVPQEPLDPPEPAEGEEPGEPIPQRPIRTLLGGGTLQAPILINGKDKEANVAVRFAPMQHLEDAGIRVLTHLLFELDSNLILFLQFNA